MQFPSNSKGRMIEQISFVGGKAAVHLSDCDELLFLKGTNAVAVCQIVHKIVAALAPGRIVLNNEIWIDIAADLADAMDCMKLSRRPAQLLIGEVVRKVMWFHEFPLRFTIEFKSGNSLSFCSSTNDNGLDAMINGQKVIAVSESDCFLKLEFSNTFLLSIPIKFPPLDESNSCATYKFNGKGPFILDFGSEHDMFTDPA